MKHISAPIRNLAILFLLLISFVACDRDFATIDSDIIDENAAHFDTRNNDFEVLTYNKVLGPVQANNYPSNLLGVFNDPIFGKSTYSIITQLRPSVQSPTFGPNAVLDSVIMTIPYFSNAVGVEDEETLYELDSVFGSAPIDLSIYESKYFLRSIDPDSDNVNSPQLYYANGSNGTNDIPQELLEGVLIDRIEDFKPDNREISFADSLGVVTRFTPSLRLELNKDYFQEKILDQEGNAVLSNANNFNNYFRGLYIKASSEDENGNLTIFNLGAATANITLYFTRDNTGQGQERFGSSFVLNFSGNRLNLISPIDFALPESDETDGDERLFLKGGQGSYALVKLFGGTDVDDDPALNQFEVFKNDFVETDENGNFKKAKRLINEANLVFYVDPSYTDNNANVPDRLYLFNATRNLPLVDFFGDLSTSNPLNTRSFHLGLLEREGEERDGNGIRYKFRITEHLKNLLMRDSTNVDLGLSVTSNVDLESEVPQYDVLSNDPNDKVPVSSLITPRSTVLFGNNTNDIDKKVYLEIFYTEPELNN